MKRDISERDVCAKLYAWHKEGQANRRSGAVCPYPGNTLAHMQHSAGWLQEDLRLALIAASPRYALSQGVQS